MSNETTLSTFRDIPDRMLWKAAALQQIKGFRQFADSLGVPWAVAGQHTSKSIKLPVLHITYEGAEIYLRDNFYDINICVVSEKPITTPLPVLFDGVLTPRDWEWYLGEIKRTREYSWREWTDEQMDTPGLLALTDDATSYAIKTAEEKARWTRRMVDPAWHGKDWAGGALAWEGEFGPAVALWLQDHPFLEGISNLVPRSAVGFYKPGCTGFALALHSLEQAGKITKRLGCIAG